MLAAWRNVAVIGAQGAIGAALLRGVAAACPQARLHAISRQPVAAPPGAAVVPVSADILNPEHLAAAVARVRQAGPVDAVLIATGLLHTDTLRPEKTMRDVTPAAMHALFEANCVGPAMAIRAFMPEIPRDRPAVIAALSARVGSISDNRLGGWTSYRAAKAALNMVIRNAAIEAARRCPQAIIVGLHPGTVNSRLSAPFQSNVPPGSLFSPEHAAGCLLRVIDGLTPAQSGGLFAYDGREIAP